MKRTAELKYVPYRHFGLFFWRKCISCSQEFRRERGWRFLSRPFYNGMGRWYYLCGTCAPTIVYANEYAVDFPSQFSTYGNLLGSEVKELYGLLHPAEPPLRSVSDGHRETVEADKFARDFALGYSRRV